MSSKSLQFLSCPSVWCRDAGARLLQPRLHASHSLPRTSAPHLCEDKFMDTAPRQAWHTPQALCWFLLLKRGLTSASEEPWHRAWPPRAPVPCGEEESQSQLLQEALPLPRLPSLTRLLICLLGPMPDTSHKSMIYSPVRSVKCGLAWPRVTCGRLVGTPRLPAQGRGVPPHHPHCRSASLPSGRCLLKCLLHTASRTGGQSPRKPSKEINEGGNLRR